MIDSNWTNSWHVNEGTAGKQKVLDVSKCW
jgi:hypothetical protein